MNHFFLEAPEGFNPLDWEKEIVTYKRNLPHWRQKGATYFVTFRLADSLPHEAIQELRNLQEDLEKETADMNRFEAFKLYAKRITAKEEHLLDQGSGSCILRRDDIAEILTAKLDKFHGTRYFLGAYVIMPNHAHCIVRPIGEDYDLDQITKGWKGVSAREINQLLGNTGKSIWQEESFDTIIRDAEHLYQVIQYIGRNPSKANLEGKCPRWIAPSWEELGYGFTEKW